MPLIKGKSEKSFEHNIKTEMKHGKPQAQALAIAYAMKRKAQKKADGGEIHIDIDSHNIEPEEMEMEAPEAETENEMEGKAHGGDIVSRIMHKKYSHGGVVSNQGQSMPSHQAGSKPREFDYLVEEGGPESTQHDLGDELGNAREDHDRHDIVSKIMHSLAKKGKMPKGYPGL